MSRKLQLATVLLLAAAGLSAGVAIAIGGSDGASRAPAMSQGGSRLPVTACGTSTGRGCAPASERVDLVRPSFSRSTEVTNPLNPIARLHSAILLGSADGRRLRVETTLLPGSRTIEWEGQRIEALTSQYVSFLDGRIAEVALDWYAQADDGSVWYLGEDVFNYEEGTVADTEGTWLAGREGPAAMIMPAKPQVGDVYRPENVVGIVFEEVTVESTGETVDGPRGPVEGAIVVDELHLDGSHEEKIFAPGYGEFSTGSGHDVEALALALPTDALSGPVPAELRTLSAGANGILGSAGSDDWEGASATLGRVTAAWNAFRARGDVPPLLEAQLREALARLSKAIGTRRPARAGQAAIDLGQATLDLELRHRRPIEIDLARFDLWASQVPVHADAGDLAGVASAVATLEWIRDRIVPALDPSGIRELDARLRALRAAADAGNLRAAADHAVRVASRLRTLTGR